MKCSEIKPVSMLYVLSYTFIKIHLWMITCRTKILCFLSFTETSCHEGSTTCHSRPMPVEFPPMVSPWTKSNESRSRGYWIEFSSPEYFIVLSAVMTTRLIYLSLQKIKAFPDDFPANVMKNEFRTGGLLLFFQRSIILWWIVDCCMITKRDGNNASTRKRKPLRGLIVSYFFFNSTGSVS